MILITDFDPNDDDDDDEEAAAAIQESDLSTYLCCQCQCDSRSLCSYNTSTVAPACKVSFLSKENLPYKRADLTSGL